MEAPTSSSTAERIWTAFPRKEDITVGTEMGRISPFSVGYACVEMGDKQPVVSRPGAASTFVSRTFTRNYALPAFSRRPWYRFCINNTQMTTPTSTAALACLTLPSTSRTRTICTIDIAVRFVAGAHLAAPSCHSVCSISNTKTLQMAHKVIFLCILPVAAVTTIAVRMKKHRYLMPSHAIVRELFDDATVRNRGLSPMSSRIAWYRR